MSDHAIIEADFVSFRTIAGRKCLQLVCEVPIEKTVETLERLGTPRNGESLYVAIARLDLEAAQAQPEGQAAHPKKWSEMKRSQQAAILCCDPQFRTYFACAASAEDADEKLKGHFRITSKKELDLPENHSKWDEFVALYHLHRDRLK